MQIFDLTGKTILVTGGSTHLGRAMAEGFCQFGANVVVASRSRERNEAFAKELSHTYGVTCVGDCVDFLDGESIDKLLGRIRHQFPSLDVLVNNAALSKPGDVHRQPHEDFMEGLSGTIGGTFEITKRMLSGMMEQGSGSIIHIASMYGIVSPDPAIYEDTPFPPNPANYGCGKAAILQFSRYIACNYAKYGIRSNAISPGPFPAPSVQEHPGFIQSLESKNPLGRIGVPQDLVGAAVLLASDASSYITGQCISVDGGWTAW